MIKKFTLTFFSIVVVSFAQSQSISLTNNQTATNLANKIMGSGVTVSGATLTCHTLANGMFVNVNPWPNQSLAIDSGIVMSTGKVLSVSGSDTGINFNRFVDARNKFNITTSDAQLATIAGSSAVQRDLCKLEFTAIPRGDSMFLDYVFASEEYPEYQCSQYNDVFGVFVTQPSGSPVNYARVPGTTIPVTINSINDSTCSCTPASGNFATYCSSLGSGAPFKKFYTANTIANHIVYDGMTKVLRARIPVLPNQSHAVKIAIADIVDADFDSGLFIKQYSLTSPPLLEIIEKKSTDGNTTNPLYLIEGCNPGLVKFNRSSSSTSITVNVAFSGTASSSDYSGTTSFVIPTGSTTFSYNISAILDGLTESIETLKLTFTCPSLSYTDSANFIIKDFANGFSVYNATNDTTICNNSSTTLSYTRTDTTFSGVWTPSTNLSCTNCQNTVFTANNGNVFSTQIVNLTISANGCSSVDTPITIHIQPKPNIALAPSYTICKGDSIVLNASASPSGGTYTYSWQPNATLSPLNVSNPTAKPLTTQTYKVIVGTSAGCKDSMNATVNVSTIRNEIDSMRTTNTTCGTSNGSISLYPRTSAPYNPPYQYSINGGSTYSSTNIYNGLSAGTYNISIKNAANCRFDTTLTITAGAGAPSASFVKTNTSCGLNNGSATVTSKSGKAPLTLTWKLGTTTISTDTFINNKASGVYTLVVTDSVGCFTQYSVNILSSTAVSLGFSNTNQSCGFNNGGIVASPTGGVTPYSYIWSNGATTNSLTGLTAGTYIVTITDGNGCTKTDSTTLQNFPAIVGSKSHTNASCGLVNGSAVAIVSSGGTPPFIYFWSNGVTSPSTANTSFSINGLTAGNYYFTIQDSKGCTKIDTVVVSSSPNVSLSFTKVNASCGNLNGSITTTILTGTSPYTFAWSDGATTQNRSSLAAGNYVVTVTDSNSCTVSLSTTINTNSSPVLTTTKVNATCGFNNGSISSFVTGAKPPVTYAWSNGKTSSFIDSLAPGIYSLTITDSFGCQKIARDTILSIPYANFNATSVQPSCGFSNGSITLSSITGKAPVTILWSDGNTATSRTGLAPGTYSVIVQDSTGCSKSQTFNLAPSTSPTVTDSLINAVCTNTVGEIFLKVTDGTPAYTYLWSSGETTKNIFNKTAGTYKVTVTDSKGCTATLTDTVKRLPPPTYTDTSYKARCGFSNGWIYILNASGTQPLTYSWSHDANWTQSYATALMSTIYYTVVTDGNGCQVRDTFDLSSNGAISYTAQIKKPTCADSNGKVTLSMIGGNPPYTIIWENGDRGLVADTLQHKRYAVFIKDTLGCIARDTFSVKDSTLLKDSFNIFKTRCDTPTGKVITFPYGGKAPYKFSWSRSAKDTFGTIDSLKLGIYYLRTIDSNGCKFDTSVIILYDHYPTLKDSIVNERCDSSNAKVYIKVDSVISPIKIYWDNILDSTYVKTGLASPQTLNVYIMDSQKCIVSKNIDVTEVPVSYPNLNTVNPPCGNNLGQLTVAMGTNPKSYLWSNGDTTFSIDSLSPGNYAVTITDTSNCRFILRDTLAYTTPPIRNFILTRPNCGRSDGIIQAVITSPYGVGAVSWWMGTNNFNNVDLTVNGLKDSVYFFNITDAAGCLRKDTIRLIDSAAPTFQFVKTNSNCYNGVGKLKATPLTGSPPFSYLWYNFTTNDSITGLTAGTYKLTLSDNRGCSRVDSANILYNPKPELSLLGVDSKCGTNNGQVITTINFGMPPFTYSWSHGATTKNLSGLTAGKYVLTITDSLGCTDVDSVTISSQPPLQISISQSVAFCDLNNGSATVTILSGKPPYNYNWNGSIVNLSVSGLDSGRQIFQITDSNQCTIIDTIYIQRVSKPVISQTVTNDNCTYFVGQISTTVTGGKSPISYAWSNGLGILPNITGLGAGNYTISVTDSLGCQVTKMSTITDTAGPVVSLVVTDATCGLSNGSITANVTSTRTPLSYYWNNVSGSTTKSGINGGKFVFKVVDNRGCIKQDSVLLDTVKVLTATKNFKQGTCNVNNAYIKIKATGGTGAYSYTWSHTTANVDSVYNLSPGTYKITISDTKGCQWFDSVTIVQLGMPNVTFNKTPARCRNANGSIDAVLSNFSGTYTYLWNSGETSSLITGKSANNYSLTISDGAGCTMSASTSLTTIGVDSISLEIKQPICDINNGKIKAVPLNIAGNKTYSWNTGASIDSIVNLGGGNFSITVTDSFCTYSKSTTLVMAKSPVITLTKVNATCGLNNGRVLTSVNFGAAPFVYTWNTGANFPNLFNVDSGTYTVIISDTNNCKDTATIFVPRIPKLAASFVTANTTCGNNNGSIQTTATGGVPGYTYNWSNGNNLANLSNLLAGTYTLTLNDNGNCTIVETVVLTDKKKPDIDSVVTNAVCSKSNGSIIINIIDGTAPFTYKWNTGATSKDLLNLSSGFYSLTVVDSIGCRDSSLILVDNGATPTLSYLEVKNSTCGLSNGRIAVELPRGISPITYTWSTGVSNDTLDNIPAGKYYITVLDGRQCEIIDTFTIITSTNPNISLSSTAAYCSQAKGTITSTVTLGTPSFKFVWSNGDTSQNPKGLFSGSYSVTVIDSFLCKDTASIFVNEKKNDLTASIELFNLKCFNDLTGRVIITPMGGIYPYTYNVNSPAPDSIVYNLSAKKYIYSVFDSLGCQYTDSFTLTEPNPLSTSLVSKQDLLCYEEPSGEIKVKTTGGTAPFTYIWSSGAVGDNATGLSAGVHSVSVTDINGCKDNFTTTISQPNDIVVKETIVNNPCNGLSAGTINLSVSSGTAPYSFAWSNGFSNKDITGLSQGRYKVSITDANNCLDTFSYTLTDPDKLQLGSVNTVGLKCKEFIDGEITVNGIGGTLPYKYSLDSGKTFNFNNRFTDLNSGNYYVIIKDNNGCKSFVNTTVNTYPEFTIRAYPRDTQINLGENVSLGYNVIQGSDSWIKSTLWSDGEGLSCVDCRNPISSGYFEKIYVVEVKYFDKCKVSDSVMIRIIDTNGLFVPSAFAPESAEKDENRTFRVYANKLLSASISIYDRWGEKVFESKEAHIKGWDGTYKGQPVPSSVYSYVLEATYLGKRKVVKKGTITLVR